ncbi:hypothetical protein VNO80_25756 [Phaseolus coccineus]|uniref:Uncharacterized protein n=1 Tax=Phaseolus coccineus TaxID=3886 RepID=A0AAN9QM61_PHACN
MPSTLRVKRPIPSLRFPDLTLNLEWAGQHIADTAQPSKSQCCSITLMLPLGSQAGVTQLSDLTSYIKLIRTDTTLDLSQKAEKEGCSKLLQQCKATAMLRTPVVN